MNVKEEANFQQMVYGISSGKTRGYTDEDAGVMSDGFHTPSPMSSPCPSQHSSTQDSDLLQLHHSNTKTLRLMTKVLRHIKTEQRTLLDLDEPNNNHNHILPLNHSSQYGDCCVPPSSAPEHEMYGESTGSFLHSQEMDVDVEDRLSQHDHEFSDSELDCDSCQSGQGSSDPLDPSPTGKKKGKAGKIVKKRNSREVSVSRI